MEYEKLKVFLGLYTDWFFPKVGAKPENHPLIFLANLEKKSLANARRGLQMAVNDIVEMSSEWSPEQVAAADAKFASHGTFTLTEVRHRYSRKYLQVLKRGHIKSEQEYYLLKGIADGGGIEPGATEREKIESMLGQYEKLIVDRNPG